MASMREMSEGANCTYNSIFDSANCKYDEIFNNVNCIYGGVFNSVNCKSDGNIRQCGAFMMEIFDSVSCKYDEIFKQRSEIIAIVPCFASPLLIVRNTQASHNH